MNADDRPTRRGWHHRRSSRRGFLAGAAVLSGGALVFQKAAVAQAAEGGTGLHGAQLGACTT
jgi:hypothetical protein